MHAHTREPEKKPQPNSTLKPASRPLAAVSKSTHRHDGVVARHMPCGLLHPDAGCMARRESTSMDYWVSPPRHAATRRMVELEETRARKKKWRDVAL